MESFINTFHIDWKIIIAQAINFIIVLFILYFLVVKPLKKMMSERTTLIEGGISDAKTNAEMLKNTHKEYNEIVARAKTEAHTIFQEGKQEAENKKSEMIENAKKEVENMILNGKKMLESERAKIIEEAKEEIVSLVVKSTEKLLENHPDKNFDDNAMNKIKKI
jgi:F-type H+-transporting ATPase subunit b